MPVIAELDAEEGTGADGAVHQEPQHRAIGVCDIKVCTPRSTILNTTVRHAEMLATVREPVQRLDGFGLESEEVKAGEVWTARADLAVPQRDDIATAPIDERRSAQDALLHVSHVG